MDFREHSVEDLARRVRDREVSARELTQAALDRIAAVDGTLHSFLSVDADLALADASLVDDRLAAGEDVGPLAGIPIGVKDLEDAVGFVTTSGSALSADDAPAMTDSILVSRLRDAGCVVVGKTNTPEMGCKADTSNRLGPPTTNPWDPTRSAGGSSGGSAAAVAAGLVPLATASDGGGSIRIPAAVCGLTGFKPSLGRVPIGGVTPPGWADLSSKGVLTQRIRDTASVLDLVVGPDPSDLRALPAPRTPWAPQIDDAAPPFRAVWSPTLGYAPVDSGIAAVCQAAVDKIADAGCEVTEEKVVFPEDPVGPWLVLTAASNLRTVADLRGTPDWEQLDPDVQGSAEWATKLGSAEVIAAQDECHLLNQTLVALLKQHSFLITPTVAGRVSEPGVLGTVDGVPSINWVRFTYPFNLTRSPAGTVFVGRTDDGLPVGLQIVGPQHADAAVLRMLAWVDEVAGCRDVAPI